MSEYYIVTVEPTVGDQDDTVDFASPTWEYIVEKSLFVIYLGKRAQRMTRLDMTKLLMWIPDLKQELRENFFSEPFIQHVTLSVLATRKEVRLRLAKKAGVCARFIDID